MLKTVIALIILLMTSGQTFAAQYEIKSRIDTDYGKCYFGTSSTYWTGQSIFAKGDVTGYLWKWSGSSWIKYAEKYDSDKGTWGHAITSHSIPKGNYYWDQTGLHTASFFSGTKNTDSGYYWCTN